MENLVKNTEDFKSDASSNEKLLTTEDVCKLLKVTVMTVYNYRKKGMPYINLDGRTTLNAKKPVRFKEKDVKSWALQNKIPFYPLVRLDIEKTSK